MSKKIDYDYKLSRGWPFIFREAKEAGFKSIIADAGKSLFKGEIKFRPRNIATYYEYFSENGTIQRSIIDLSEMACGQGFFTTCEDEKAKDLCDEFSMEQNLDELLPNVARNMLIAGYLPVESKMNKLPSKCGLQIVYPPSVDEIIFKEDEPQIDFIKQKSDSLTNPTRKIKYEDLAWFTYNRVGNDPRGCSIIQGVVDLLAYQNKSLKNMDKILERYASPLGIWKSRRDISPIRTLVENTEAGQDLFLGNLSDDEFDKLVEYVQIDPRVRFWEYIQYIDEKIYENLGAPSLGYWRNSTQASANKLDDIVMRHVRAIQRNVKRVVEARWFKPLCELNGLKEVPRIEWGFEKTGLEDLDLSGFLIAGLNAGYVTMRQFMDVCQQMGIRIEAAESSSGHSEEKVRRRFRIEELSTG